MAKAKEGSKWNTALELFAEMKEAGLQPNRITYNALFSALEKAPPPHGSEWEKALSLFETMKAEGVKASSGTFTLLISAMEKARPSSEWVRAEELFTEMKEKNIQPSTHTYNSLIRSLANVPAGSSHWVLALHYFEEMKEEGVPRDLYTYKAIIYALARAEGGGEFDLALRICRESEEDGVRLTLPVYNFLLRLLEWTGNGSRWREALRVMDEMRLKKVRPCTFTYNLLLACLAKAGGKGEGQWMVSLGVFEEMKAEGIAPDANTFAALIFGLASRAGGCEWERAKALWEEMKLRRCALSVGSFNSMIAAAAWSESCRWREGLRLLEELLNSGLLPTRRTSRFVDSCLRRAELDRGVAVFRESRSSTLARLRDLLMLLIQEGRTKEGVTFSFCADEWIREFEEEGFGACAEVGVRREEGCVRGGASPSSLSLHGRERVRAGSSSSFVRPYRKRRRRVHGGSSVKLVCMEDLWAVDSSDERIWGVDRDDMEEFLENHNSDQEGLDIDIRDVLAERLDRGFTEASGLIMDPPR
eukprot:Cvel_27280.t1-p1 / transcript=Cvel_27280.t1 / gene=Cvel_27280 / organism=Chromera_velia_CCMP2878 / gene_product=Pentatricopeptide repeat-containing protein, putative / transcript_product=Pentatricopeptide repeat-containing protein, putative / location=Cvel_scaffold3379:4701-6290(+) / protein_length=530 / sequence_SO=supercontig / SO=protein_coding / is_pseudo=false